jgi:hypothetical protein
MRYAFMSFSSPDASRSQLLGAAVEYGHDGYLSGEWIDWEPGQTHLPREIAALREYEAALNA